jgi:hypothetical protein
MVTRKGDNEMNTRLSEGDAARLLAELGSEWVPLPAGQPIPMEFLGKGGVQPGEVRPIGGHWYMVISVDRPHYFSSKRGGGWTTRCEVCEIAEPREEKREAQERSAVARSAAYDPVAFWEGIIY